HTPPSPERGGGREPQPGGSRPPKPIEQLLSVTAGSHRAAGQDPQRCRRMSAPEQAAQSPERLRIGAMHVVNHDEQPPGGTRRGGRARADGSIPAVTPAST